MGVAHFAHTASWAANARAPYPGLCVQDQRDVDDAHIQHVRRKRREERGKD
ncbi:MAG: hypothetical protein ACREM1_04585 [Longimicrobiales bacterium]